MKRRKRVYVIIIEVLILFIMVGVYISVQRIQQKSLKYTYENYEIIITNNRYSKGSHCGRIDLEIRQKNGETRKLFDTSEDRIHDGSDVIIDEEEWLQIRDESYIYESEAYETKYIDGVQNIAVHYINKNMSGEVWGMHLVLVDKQSEEEKFNIAIAYEKDERMLIFTNEKQRVYVTAEGIMIHPGMGSDLYQSIAMKTGVMNIKWKYKNREFALRGYAETAGYTSAGGIKSKVRWTDQRGGNSGNRCYAVELDDWDKIEEIHIGNYVFTKHSER